MQLLIQLRWFAVVGQVITISLVHYGFGINLPLPAMALVLMASVFTNLGYIYWYRSHRRQISARNLFLALLADVLALAIQLYLSGGASNPFIYLFLLQGILGAVLLRPVHAWIIVASTSLCTLVLAIVHWPLPIGAAGPDGLPGLYVSGILISFGLTTVLLVVFLRRIVSNLRRRDARLANMRQRASEEEHIVRMGLLASGAAHELGTPLSTLAVILGDWQHLPHFTSDPELAEEVTEMEAQVQRCKAIVSGILLSAGEARGESSEETTICTFLDELVEDWRRRRPSAGTAFTYSNRFGQDLPAVSDSALRQMVGNVLDNALEASPQGLHFDAAREGDALVLTVTDQGPGFLPAMLQQLGKPYQSSKGRPGGGLGLFLVVNVARTVGGTVTARNRQEGGAEVKITLPLAAIALAEEEDADAA